MENDGTTLPRDDTGKRRARRRRMRHPRGQRSRPSPMWQEPVRGALYAAGSGLIALAVAWVQSRM